LGPGLGGCAIVNLWSNIRTQTLVTHRRWTVRARILVGRWRADRASAEKRNLLELIHSR
jgi:hypothetical protein